MRVENNKKGSGRLWQISIILLLAGLLLWSIEPAAAQGEGRVVISLPETGQFPTISLYMEAYDEQGLFIADLQPAEVEVLEDGEVIKPTSWQRMNPGLQIAVAISPGPMFDNHMEGVSNYERVQERLINWAMAQPFETPDDFSLVSSTGENTTHRTMPQDWADAIAAYQPEALSLKPDISSLVQALNLVSDPLPDPMMKRTILFITGTMDDENVAQLSVLSEQAAQLGVRVHAWLVGSPPAAESSSAQALIQLADRTGGEYYFFTGAEELPDPELHFQPLRYIYYLGYTSSVQESGVHDISVRITRDKFQATSDAAAFEAHIMPPNPIFLAPPVQVLRSWNEKGKEAYLEPSYIPIQAIFEFPDGIERQLSSASLYVDGKKVAENVAPPFNVFAWELYDIGNSGRHLLQVKVVDELGLGGASIETPVEVIIEPKPEDLFSGRRLVIGASVLAAAIVLALVMILSGRFNLLKSRMMRRQAFSDPVTQPVESYIEPPSQPLPTSRAVKAAAASVKAIRNGISAPAQLVFLQEDGYPRPGGNITLNKPEITLGSDPKQAIRVLSSPSVGSLHARLFRTGEGFFMLADEGSIAGTWVNYAPVSTQGARLRHGDLVHIGRVAFRFEMSNPPPTPQLQIPPDIGDEL